MVFKPSATLRDHAPARFASGDRVFRLFLGLAAAGCLWTTVIRPELPALGAWATRLLGG